MCAQTALCHLTWRPASGLQPWTPSCHGPHYRINPVMLGSALHPLSSCNRLFLGSAPLSVDLDALLRQADPAAVCPAECGSALQQMLATHAQPMEASQPSDADEQWHMTDLLLVPSYLRNTAQPQARDVSQPEPVSPEQCLPLQHSPVEGPAGADVLADNPGCDEVSDSAWLNMHMDDEDTAAGLPDAQLGSSCGHAEEELQAGTAQSEGGSGCQRPHVPALQKRRRAFVLHDEDEPPQPSSPTTALPAGESSPAAHALQITPQCSSPFRVCAQVWRRTTSSKVLPGL
jgi:hypothetical protein